jgi:hypothetical protein
MSGKILARRPNITGDVRLLDHRLRTLDSTVNQLKIYMSGSGTVNLVKDTEYGDDREIIDIAHNLGYQPFFAGYFKNHNDTEWCKIVGGVTINCGGTDESFIGAMGRPSDNIIQLHFYTMSFFGPQYNVNLDYNYIIYVDPYKDAW